MSELMNTPNDRGDFRRQLLAAASATALLAFVCVAQQAQAADGDSGRPPFWIELGGAFTRVQDDQDAYLPPFAVATPRPPFIVESPFGLEKSPPSSWDGTAKVAFEPAGTDWVFSARILYGKGTHHAVLDQQTSQPTPGGANYLPYQHFTTQSDESHTVLDFQAGKDVGLGMFGSHGSSVFSLGVRYAQFNAQTNTKIRSQPTNASVYAGYERFYASLAANRKFTGVGPSLSWDASAGLIGNPASSEIAIDWGINVAVLFGRQTLRGHHQTTKIEVKEGNGQYVVPIYQTSAPLNRSKQVVVPNLGGFAGVSWRASNAKVSLGYRADFFFGAMDGGIDAAHRENVGFYGPFASVSIGVGG